MNWCHDIQPRDLRSLLTHRQKHLAVFNDFNMELCNRVNEDLNMFLTRMISHHSSDWTPPALHSHLTGQHSSLLLGGGASRAPPPAAAAGPAPTTGPASSSSRRGRDNPAEVNWASSRPRPTHFATASTEPAIGLPPPSPLSYSTPEISSSTPRTPASRWLHAAIASHSVPQPRSPSRRRSQWPRPPRGGVWEV